MSGKINSGQYQGPCLEHCYHTGRVGYLIIGFLVGLGVVAWFWFQSHFALDSKVNYPPIAPYNPPQFTPNPPIPISQPNNHQNNK